ncbi:UvrD-helicase domain-containing protein, partial [Enterococcus cecorum]
MSNVDLKLLDSLSSEQKNACVCMENMLLTACPGSGKTRTVSYKLAFLVNQFQDSRKLHIAITYTNRAADEIMARLDAMDVTADNIWTGTIHQFCMEYIIRPYSMYSDRLRKGYHIIDEYVQHEYKREIKNTLGINCKDWEIDKHPRIKEVYK